MKRAFTLIELLIYMGVIGTLLTLLGTILVSTLNLQLESQATSVVEADGRFLLARLGYDLHRADSLISPAAAGETTSSLTISAAGQTSTYSVTAGSLLLTTPTSSLPLNSFATQVDSFSLTRLANPNGLPTVQARFILSQLDERRDYQITVGLRN